MSSGSPKKSAVKARRGKMVRKQVSSKKVKHNPKQVSESQDSEMLHLNKPLYPLRHYLNDRTEFVGQLFLSLSSGNQLQRILPAILKDIPIEELKRLCVQQLEVMSKKRINRILDGNEMESSSETEDSDGVEEEKSETKEIKTEDIGENVTAAQAPDSTSSDLNEASVQQLSIEQCESIAVKPDDDMLELHADSADDAMLGIVENFPLQESDQLLGHQPSTAVEAVNSEAPLTTFEDVTPLATSSITKTCMEIMELELRARAIKSLLKTQASKDSV